ncbi:conjugal transfer protein TraF [Acinetobacter pittii]|uniref:conjugal transfer protein TraF n=1 Tax=Acinetobacter calcoaceticus/baumannii complex TaxID=909768 RepID=UPI002956F4B7|nr:conjugal transfer protein TraF [Acinetobacter baumannii]
MNSKALYLVLLSCLPISAFASLDELVNKWSNDLGFNKTEPKLAKTFISTEQLLKNSSKDNAIIFFFRSDCAYCHKYAPILKQFASNYGYAVLSYSLDGRGLPDYPKPRYSPQLAQRLNVMGVPATYILNPRLNRITNVSYGLSDYSTLTSNMLDALASGVQK